MKKSFQEKQVKNVPSPSGEELDVWEALYQLEKRHGKVILKPEQKEKLQKHRGYLEKVNQLPTVKKDVLEKNSGTEDKVVEILLVGLRKGVESTLIHVLNYCSVGEWNKKDDLVKSKVLNLFYYLFYGVSEEQMRGQLQKMFINN